MASYTVYKHTCLKTGKSYIGQTSNMIARQQRHRSPSSGCRAFYSAINKYGWDSFTTEVLGEGLTLDQANVLEEEQIAHQRTLVPSGYNLKYGGNNKAHSMEVRQHISDSLRGKPKKPFSEAHKQKLAAVLARGRETIKQRGKPQALRDRLSVEFRGAGNHNAKTYHFVDPTGYTHIVTGRFEAFCVEKNITPKYMREVLRNERSVYKGWFVQYANARELA